jgi:hypothetical protein
MMISSTALIEQQQNGTMHHPTSPSPKISLLANITISAMSDFGLWKTTAQVNVIEELNVHTFSRAH